jgi:hypothetical protein
LHDEVSPERPNLIEQGWHPGVVFSAPGASYSLNQLTEEGGYEEVCNFVLSEDDRLVLISHECDIVSRDELYVEALVCHVVNPNESKLIQWDRNSARRFVVDFDTAYVADATKRLKILKRDLPTANDGSPMDDERRRRFVDWLGARYIRPVVPDNLASDFVNPVRELFRRWTKRNKDPECSVLDSLEQVRFRILGESEVGILYLLKATELGEGEEEALALVHEQARDHVAPKITVREEFEFDGWYEVANGHLLATLELTGVDYLTVARSEMAESD